MIYNRNLSDLSLKVLLGIWVFLFFFEYSYISIILRFFNEPIIINSFIIPYKILVYGSLFLLLFYLPLTHKVLMPAMLIYIIFSFLRLYFGGSITNLISSAPVFILTFFVARHIKNGFNLAFYILIISNLFIICFQFLGLHESFYYLSHSSNDPLKDFSFLQTNPYLPLHQHRPHGLFASTIHLSLFEIFVFFFLIIQKNIKIIYYILYGIILTLTGSTTSLLLCVSSLLVLILNKRILYVFLSGTITFLFCMEYFPYFIEQNFSIDIIQSRFDSRLDDDRNNSFLTQSGLIPSIQGLTTICIATSVLIVYSIIIYSINYTAYLFVGVSILFVPLLIHPILNDMRFTFLIAFILSKLHYMKEPKICMYFDLESRLHIKSL